MSVRLRVSRNFPNQMRNFRHLFRSLGSRKQDRAYDRNIVIFALLRRVFGHKKQVLGKRSPKRMSFFAQDPHYRREIQVVSVNVHGSRA